jgi:hypothetical protein
LDDVKLFYNKDIKNIESFISVSLNTNFKLPFLNKSKSDSIIINDSQLERLKKVYKDDYEIIKKLKITDI